MRLVLQKAGETNEFYHCDVFDSFYWKVEETSQIRVQMKSNISSIRVFTDALVLQYATWRLRTVSGGGGVSTLILYMLEIWECYN